ASSQKVTETSGGKPLTERRNNAPGDENVLCCLRALINHHGVLAYHREPLPRRRRHPRNYSESARAVSMSSRACMSPLSESARPESSLAISAMRSSPCNCCTLLAVTEPSLSLTTLRWLVEKAAT